MLLQSQQIMPMIMKKFKKSIVSLALLFLNYIYTDDYYLFANWQASVHNKKFVS